MIVTWCRMQALRRSFSTSCQLGNKSRPRVSEMKIQLLSETLHKQIFKTQTSSEVPDIYDGIYSMISEGDYSVSDKVDVDLKSDVPLQPVKTVKTRKFDEVKEHLQQHGLWDKDSRISKNVEFKLPPLLGKTIDEHFEKLGERLVGDYTDLADRLASCKIPKMPTNWRFKEGWTRYEKDGTATSIDYPDGDALVFDVETVVTEGSYPTMAAAVSDTHWYSWSSDYLVNNPFRWSQVVNIDDLIPLEPGSSPSNMKTPRLVVGHNVGFDRSFAKEQYYVNKSNLRFMDTMSMHIAVCGLSNLQRVLYRAGENDSKIKKVEEYRQKQRERRIFVIEDWKEVSSLNNLQAVHQLHVGGKVLDKDIRNTFIEGTTEDVRENFQDLMTYCASDVVATLEVFKALWPEFQNRFPHHVTLAGMMEMGSGYLPINQNWERYIHQSNAVYEDMQRESKQLLMKLANDTCELLQNERYKDDPWLWDLDWSVKEFKIKKARPPKKKTKEEEEAEEAEEEESCVDQVLKLQDQHYKVGNFMSGYPIWYKDICAKLTDPAWAPGPCNISSQTRITPKLLRLTWDGYPLHFDDQHGWGYLVPGRTDNLVTEDEDLSVAPKERHFPYKALHQLLSGKTTKEPSNEEEDVIEDDPHMTEEELQAALLARVLRAEDSGQEISLDEVMKYMNDIEHKRKRAKAKLKPVEKTTMEHVGDGPYNSVNIPGCWFYKIPHKDGKGKRVGNPLAKDYLMHMEDGTLNAHSGQDAGRVLKLNKMYSYWKNNQKRIESQMLVWLNEQDLPNTVKQGDEYRDGYSIGAIVPRIVPAGTITRRAVEKTWLTASNAYEDRVGSELKSMVQCPPGYCFVGADVDSQELWIGAILGDAKFAKSHGCTALGWMTLQGNKQDGTDLHSKVAKTVGVSRDHAKIFNYGRIYGAGQSYAEKLLMQFNHRLTEEEAKRKAKLMFTTTKGKKDRKTGKWAGGSESYMFNKLEEIARSNYPKTPVLGCRISKALEPENVNEDFMTSRINWVVQSSAVDYLHLMLVCMRWLFEEYEIDGRFCISIHDEVRYLVAEKDKYRAALALQITNLLTRSLFAYKLGMYDLPQSVAFFSTVDIDRCLRKEVDLKCVTPSNIHGMDRGYQMHNGEALNIHDILYKTGGTLEKGSSDKRDSAGDKSQNNNGDELMGTLRSSI